jgi:hypothetical protein
MENPVIDLTVDDHAVEFPLTNTLRPAPIAIGGGSKKKSATSDTCDICAEKFNKTTREMIDCTFCQFVACKTCCQTYILNSTQPCCMNPECAKPWPRKFINEHFSQLFVNIHIQIIQVCGIYRYLGNGRKQFIGSLCSNFCG